MKRSQTEGDLLQPAALLRRNDLKGKFSVYVRSVIWRLTFPVHSLICEDGFFILKFQKHILSPADYALFSQLLLLLD